MSLRGGCASRRSNPPTLSEIASGEKQGREFAKSTDKEGCLVEASRRLSKCEGMCLEQGVFLGSCLVNTSGDKEVFCSDKPTDDSDYSKGTWRQHCSNNSLSKLQCELFFKSFTAYCRGEFDNK